MNNITDVNPGHQCYSIDRLEGISAGTNATIQLEYWSEFEGENNGNNQSFFACADIVSSSRFSHGALATWGCMWASLTDRITDTFQTFVETIDFSIKVPCFNVTSDEFDAPTPSSSGSSPSNTGLAGTQTDTPSSSPSSSGGGGLSTGAKAGIAVGSIIGGLAILGAVGFFLWRRGKNAGLKNKDAYELRAKSLGTPPGSTTA